MIIVIIPGIICALSVAIGCFWFLQILQDPPKSYAYENLVIFCNPEKAKKCYIELIGKDGSSSYLQTRQGFPDASITLDPNTTYSFKYRSRRRFQLTKGLWSEEIHLDRKKMPYNIPSEISNKACEKLRKNIQESGSRRVLMLGKTGEGKSSFINTLFAAFYNTWNPQTFPCSQDESVTFEQNEYQLVKDKIMICDMPGYNRNYNFSLLQKIINGECRATISAMQTKESQQPQEDQSQRSPKQNFGKIDVAIVIIGANESEELNQVNQRLFEKLREYHLPYITVVTKVDEFAHSTTSNFAENLRVIQRCEQLQGYSEQVLPIINYTNYKQNNTYIDFFALQSLCVALKFYGSKF